MGMSEFYGPSDISQSEKLLDKAIELGCNFWDTADMYGPFKNEELLGASLSGRREQVILATKFGIKRGSSGSYDGVFGDAKYVKSCCEASLTRLGTDYIDLYYQHRVDSEVPIEETVGAMADLVKEGKIKYIGLSEASSDLIRRANKVHPISALQTEYSLWSRDVENDILPTCNELGIGFVAYSPLGRGFLTGTIKSPEQDLDEQDWRRSNPRFQASVIDHNWQLVKKIQNIAEQNSVTASQVALAWVLSKSDQLATIPGTRRETYLQQNIAAAQLNLPEDSLLELDKFSSEFTVQGERY
jgi:aryl-alcohol dehydrogenase-like predicted oxidoreductase